VASTRVIVSASIIFLAWLTMKFHMDNANDSETQAYVGALLWNLQHLTPSTDALGHYTLLAPIVIWPSAMLWHLVSAGYEIRGLALALLACSAMLYGLAYAWYRQLRLGWLTALFGLMLLSVGVSFALLIRGWELDKLLEPVLFLAAALLASRGQYALVVLLGILAASNRESGIFVCLVPLAFVREQRGSWSAALREWPVWATFSASLVVVIWMQSQLPLPGVRPFSDSGPEHLVYLIGGTCLVPVFAVAWRSAAPRYLRHLLYLLGPVWVVFAAATDKLEQGAVLLALVALVCVPITLLGFQQVLRPAPRPVPEPDAAFPVTPSARESTLVAPGT
jgi:hypothetical protein